ncbi:RNA polymerase II transcription factor B subunit 1 [Rhizina undulata]
MATTKASVAYKKKDGTLLLAKDGITWTPAVPPNAPPSLTIPIATVSNLQATPATAAKVMIKIFAAKDADAAPEPYTFSFTSASARAEADAMKEALTAAIQATKVASGPATPAAGGTPGAAVTAKTSDIWSKSQLETDMELQQSLLKSDQELTKTFSEAVLSGAVTAAQFWSTRTHLLRAHAIERSQQRGPYNVLASIKPRTVDNVVKMSLSREQIRDIFDQHPLVKIVYDENVPRLPEGDFWSRFFMSRLFKKLKGEKLLPTDNTDNILDRYLNRDDEENERKRRRVETVPRTIDLEGNEQNLSQKRGNKPDLTMRPSKVESVPIIRTLNSLSKKLVDLVAPADGDPSQNDDQDERYMNEQALADLRGDPEEERIILNIQDQRRFFADDSADTDKGKKYAALDPAKVLEDIKRDLGTGLIDLAAALGGNVDYDEDGGKTGKPKLSDATKKIMAAIRDRRSQLMTSSSASSPLTGGFPQNVFESVLLVHATTNEFLHHFWLAFLSGDEKRAGDITTLVNCLKKSKERIEAVANTAEEEKELERQRKKKEAQEEYKRTGVRPKRKAIEPGGGKAVVLQMLQPTLISVDKALSKYQDALEEAEKLGSGA